MIQHIKAIYENGILRPLSPLDLGDAEIVSLAVERTDESDILDDNYMPFVAADGDPNISWDEVRAVLAKLPGSLAEDFIRERDERFE